MEPVAAYRNLVERLIRAIKESKKGLASTLRAADLGEQHLRSTKHRRNLRLLDLLKILEVLEIAPPEFFREAFAGETPPSPTPAGDRRTLRQAILDQLWRELDGAPPGTKRYVTKCVGKSESFLRQIRRGETSVVSGLGELGAILDCLAMNWTAFLRQVLEHEDPDFRAAAGGEAGNGGGDPVEQFLESAGPPPRELAFAAEGFDDPVPPDARTRLEEIERLRPEKPAAAAEMARGLVRSLNLNVSLRAAALWASCLRLEIDLPAAAAVIAGAIPIARAKGCRRAEADLLYQMAFVVADDAHDGDGYLTAAGIVERAVLEYLNLADLNQTALAQAAKAVFLLYSGEPKTALVILRASEALAQAPLLKAQIFGNMAIAAIQLRRLDVARQYAASAAGLFKKADAPRQDVGRFLWLRARLETDQDAAESLFLEARDVLAHLKADCALLNLDLARSYLKWHRPADAAEAAREAAVMASALVPKSQLVRAVGEQLFAAAEAGRVSAKLLAAARRVISGSLAARTIRRLDRPR